MAFLSLSARSHALLLVTLVGAGCPADKGETTADEPTGSATTGPTAGSTGSTTAEPTTATEPGTTTAGEPACDLSATNDCCCFTLEEEGFLRNDCAEAPLCGSLQFECSLFDGECPIPENGSGGEPAEFTVNDPAALTCVLEALRDGTPGLVAWSFRDAESSGEFTSYANYHVQADRRAFAVRYDRADLNLEIFETTEETLKGADHFAGCLQAGDVRAMALCLHATTTGEVAQVCAPGGLFDSI